MLHSNRSTQIIVRLQACLLLEHFMAKTFLPYWEGSLFLLEL